MNQGLQRANVSVLEKKMNKEAAENSRISFGETEDGNTGERRSNEFGEPFPDEDGDEDDPEETQSLLLREDGLVAVERVEKIDGRDEGGEDDVGREDTERSH